MSEVSDTRHEDAFVTGVWFRGCRTGRCTRMLCQDVGMNDKTCFGIWKQPDWDRPVRHTVAKDEKARLAGLHGNVRICKIRQGCISWWTTSWFCCALFY
uniref:hypothetical protein n=1 Tax=Enterocloster aldenensis TaxID=358742 RepID=UPI0013F5BEF0